MRIRTLLRTTVAACIGLLAVPACARATTITFDEFEAPGSGAAIFSGPYVAPQNGFVLTEFPADLFAYFLQQDTSYAGSAGLADEVQEGTVEISDGGTAFTLNSIDLSFLLEGSGSVAVTFTGNYVGGGSTMQTLTGPRTRIDAALWERVGCCNRETAPAHRLRGQATNRAAMRLKITA